jgi:TonB family protein
MYSISRCTLRVLSACVLAAILLPRVPSSLAQATPNPLQDSATQIAAAISHAKLPQVIVFDFSGPGKKMTLLGQDFAATFRAALAGSSPKFQVEDAQTVGPALDRLLYAPEIALYPESLLAAAQDLQASGFVMGEMSIDGDKLTIQISAYRSRDGKALRAMVLTWALTDDLKALVEKKAVNLASSAGGAPIFDGGTNGITSPKCLYCPRANYSSEAMDHKLQGVTALVVIVETDGTIDNIRVVKTLPFGLTAKAMEAVRKWKLAPAVGPDGKPVRVRQIIEVTFQLF